MQKKLEDDQKIMQSQAQNFVSLLQNLVSETVAATQVQHKHLQGMLGLASA
jgi:hypothetical protein